MPVGLIATTAVRDTVERAVRTYRWPHLAVALVDQSLFGLPRDEIARLGAHAAERLVYRLTAPSGDVHRDQE